ncbi:MAG: hypothetical protein ABH832_00920 [bacterium]
MNSNQFKKIIKVMRRTGDKIIVPDSESDSVFVLMDLNEYERMLASNVQLKGMPEDEMMNRINRDISLWRALNESQSLDFYDNCGDFDDYDDYWFDDEDYDDEDLSMGYDMPSKADYDMPNEPKDNFLVKNEIFPESMEKSGNENFLVEDFDAPEDLERDKDSSSIQDSETIDGFNKDEKVASGLPNKMSTDAPIDDPLYIEPQGNSGFEPEKDHNRPDFQEINVEEPLDDIAEEEEEEQFFLEPIE